MAAISASSFPCPLIYFSSNCEKFNSSQGYNTDHCLTRLATAPYEPYESYRDRRRWSIRIECFRVC
jgi:hypothetical protein